MERITLFEEFRLIERSEAEVNGAWKGAHLLLFFMAFVFGSFCTFCFHMLMYLFDEKCVLFPKLLSLTASKHNVIYEFFPVDKEAADMLPLDFLGTQWVEKSACYLPTYVPLMSGIFGLVWTTMFLMCSTGSRTLTGLQRPWRVLPPVFVFSLAMGCLCIYTSAVTHYGLNELCVKLGEITGSSTCTYTVNVATLAYERRIRGVYQAIKLTIFSAWLHTLCWLLSTLLTLARVILAVDFQLVRINVDLVGDIDKMLERHEKQIRTVSPEVWFSDETTSGTSLRSRVRFQRTQTRDDDDQVEVLFRENNDVLYISPFKEPSSEISLVSEENRNLKQESTEENVPEEMNFISRILNNLLQYINLSENTNFYPFKSGSTGNERPVIRQLGRGHISSNDDIANNQTSLMEATEAEEMAIEIRRLIQAKLDERFRDTPASVQYEAKLDKRIRDTPASVQYEPVASTSAAADNENKLEYESVLNITDEMRKILEGNQKFKRPETLDKEEQTAAIPKSNLRNASVQTDTKKKADKQQRVHITEPEDQVNTSTDAGQDVEKETQTSKKKEKQD